MSRFNNVTNNKTTNLAGGQAYRQSPEAELLSILFTSFVNDQFYRSANDTLERVKYLVQVCNKQFVAKAAIYARTEFGMRSITHVVASELAKYISGEQWAKSFYDSIIYRPDDMTEIISYHKRVNGKITNSMKKGFAFAFLRFNEYQLAKYRGENKTLKLVDVANLVHPKGNETIGKLINGTLKSFDTWEVELTKAGQKAKTEKEKEILKATAWHKLIHEEKLGYFALLRNLRNIIEQAPESLPKALEILTNEEKIKKSLVLPFRFITAIDQIKQLSNEGVRDILVALNKAVDISLDNVPKMDGKTLIALDVSGSMTFSHTSTNPAKIGALFSSALYKTNNADLLTFDNSARYVQLNPLDSLLTLSESINFLGGATNFHSIFDRLDKKYDRIIILSDMQGWVGYNTPKEAYNRYKLTTGANPFIYSFDLQGYGSMQFPENNVFCLAGFSEKIFDVMKYLEEDKNAIIKKINSLEF